MKKRHVLTILLTAVIAASLMVAGCQDAEQAAQEKSKKLLILYPNWAEGIAITHLAKVALKDKGYDPTIKPIEPGPIYASLAQGDCELFLDAWLPHTHKNYWEKFGDQLVKIGESFSNGTTGLVVPAYVEENSMLALKDPEVAEKYNKKIFGIGSGAGIHKNTLRAIEAYDLPLKQITSSGPAMMAALEKAYSKQKPIIVTGWKPHFMWNRFDLKYLEDPKGIYPKDVMAILARQGFKEDYPELADFFSKFNFEESKLYDLMETVKNSKDPETGAQKWYEENKALINKWWG
ncbi:MAG: glycine betaine ABC transporter substrate-binding protein [Thermodesulfobacteriota bacterium]|nr:glycine betaine ABC transporter substrate-binding protein [Thermodesulfobacteriota bacterium]